MRRIVNVGILIVAIIFLNNNDINAQYVLKEADQQFNLYNYDKAVDLYASAYQKKKTLHAAERLAEGYRLMRKFVEAEKWYSTLVSMDGSKPEAILWYAKMLQINTRYAEAKTQFIKYSGLVDGVDKTTITISISSCDSALKWIKNPLAVSIVNEQNLNSKQSDWGLVKYGESLVFSSDRGVKIINDDAGKPFLKFDGDRLPDRTIYGWTGNNYLHLYQANGANLSLFPLPTTGDYHISSATFNGNGEEMFYALTRVPKTKILKENPKTINVEIYSSKKQNQNWGIPVAFGYNNIEKWSVGDPCLSKDGNTLYFSSNQPGGKGGTDIYYCKRNTDGSWANPINLNAINTPGDERTPSIGDDGFFYFSSDGSVGMGGLDIYKTKLVGKDVSTIQNMGYPINSSYDDFAFVAAGKLNGYFSSNREGGIGSDDIYRFSIKEKPVVKPIEKPVYSLVGKALNKDNKSPLKNAIVRLTALNGASINANTDDFGNFEFRLAEKTDYNLVAEKTGYITGNSQITTNGLATSTQLKQDLYLSQIIIGKTIRIENILYDFNKFDIRPDAALELDKMVTTLRENPTIWIELGSHTDSRGNDEYNLKLSQSRANSAVNYIVGKGIGKERITAKGYGETKLINSCANNVKCSDEEHQLNRRTEFKIVKQ